MSRAAFVFAVELQLHCDGITHFGIRRFADITMEIKIKTPVTDRHQVDAPLIFRFAIDADADRKRLAPVFPDSRDAPRADKHIRINVLNRNR